MKVSDYLRQAARPIPIDKGNARQIAEKLYAELMAKLKHTKPERPLSTFLYSQLRDVAGHPLAYRSENTFQYSDVVNPDQKRFVPILIEIGPELSWTSPRKFVRRGQVLRMGPKGERDGKVQLILELADLDVEKYTDPSAKGLLTKELYSVLIHEITHLRDLLEPIEERSRAELEERTEEEYYNRPSELRAFMQQVVDEALEFAEEQHKTSVFQWDAEELVSYALKHSATWQRIQERLKPDSRKRILKAVHYALVAQKESLKK